MPERRHRIRGDELRPIKTAIRNDILKHIEERDNLLGASILFRIWYRIHTHSSNKPKYPPHETWEELEIAMRGVQ